MTRIRNIKTEMAEEVEVWSLQSQLDNFWKIHPALLYWAMKTLSSSLRRGVFHYWVGIPPQQHKVTQLSSLQMPAPQKETTLLRKLLVILQLHKQKQSTGILLKCVFPSNWSVIFSCTVSTTKLHIKCEYLVKRKQSFFILSHSYLLYYCMKYHLFKSE